MDKINLDYFVNRNIVFALYNLPHDEGNFDAEKVDAIPLSMSKLMEILRQSLGGALKDYHDELHEILKEKGIDIGEAEFTDLYSPFGKN